MSEMDDDASEDFMEYEDSDDGFDSGADSDASAGIDDGPAIERQISEYKVLNAGDCSAAAQKQVREVAELLCCDEETCSLMLRYFRWNREKLMEGVLHDLAPPLHPPSPTLPPPPPQST